MVESGLIVKPPTGESGAPPVLKFVPVQDKALEDQVSIVESPVNIVGAETLIVVAPATHTPLPSQTAPAAQFEVTMLWARKMLLLERLNVSELYLTARGTLVPEFPVATVTLTGFLTTEVPIGFVVVQEKFILQVLSPNEITQEEDAGVRVPDMSPKPV